MEMHALFALGEMSYVTKVNGDDKIPDGTWVLVQLNPLIKPPRTIRVVTLSTDQREEHEWPYEDGKSFLFQLKKVVGSGAIAAFSSSLDALEACPNDNPVVDVLRSAISSTLDCIRLISNHEQSYES